MTVTPRPAAHTGASGAARDSDVREIDTGVPPTRFARGWHCLGLLSEFDDGEPHSITVFGTKLALWVHDGEVNILSTLR